MARSLGQMDDPEEVRRLVYVSWLAGDALSAAVQKRLMDHLRLPDYDDAGRELQLLSNDPTEAASEEVAKARLQRDMANDYVGLFTTRYLARTKELGKASDPDLFFFLARKCAIVDAPLAMWILPVQAVALRHVGFKEMGIRSLAFPWWKGWRGDDDQIRLPDGTPRAEADFDNDIRQRVSEILAHSGG
ncbi:MAG: hypothetical protein E6Q92_11010 [Burkholderiaceae bacterium]|nr:MAG: hypothetical protein E6Q92_11010 [Burkholderiaceae bacterium]